MYVCVYICLDQVSKIFFVDDETSNFSHVDHDLRVKNYDVGDEHCDSMLQNIIGYYAFELYEGPWRGVKCLKTLQLSFSLVSIVVSCVAATLAHVLEV